MRRFWLVTLVVVGLLVAPPAAERLRPGTGVPPRAGVACADGALD